MVVTEKQFFKKKFKKWSQTEANIHGRQGKEKTIRYLGSKVSREVTSDSTQTSKLKYKSIHVWPGKMHLFLILNYFVISNYTYCSCNHLSLVGVEDGGKMYLGNSMWWFLHLFLCSSLRGNISRQALHNTDPTTSHIEMICRLKHIMNCHKKIKYYYDLDEMLWKISSNCTFQEHGV